MHLTDMTDLTDLTDMTDMTDLTFHSSFFNLYESYGATSLVIVRESL